MPIALGIDTGGTYTDAVLVEQRDGSVRAAAKALTTRHDLAVGISQAVAAAFRGSEITPSQVELVALSTTLATNAIVEGKGGPVALLLAGYDPALIRQYGFEAALATRDVVYLRGGHDGAGNEVEPLDEEAARQAIRALAERVEAFAISGYFGVRNPAHELRLRTLVEEMTGLPVTCGHELTGRLNGVRRATTAALNARLIPLLRGLVATVRRTLDDLGIPAPLMVVKGDGSLVRAEWASARPIETVLSGPAASLLGAWHLSGRRDAWVVDVGGTTTDIAALRDGRPRLNPDGARVGGWQTMVEAADVHTVGLGGDSLVRWDAEGELRIGPRRVIPLCLLATQYPQIVERLRQTAEDRSSRERGRHDLAAQFVLKHETRPGDMETRRWGDEENGWMEALEAGPQPMTALLDGQRYSALLVRRVEEMETRGLLLRAGFTPTDALHALGRFTLWERDASRYGAAILAGLAGLTVEDFCKRVIAAVSDRIVQELVSKVLNDEATPPDWEREPAARAFLLRALGGRPDSDLGCQLRLRRPLVAIGAPVTAYMPRVAEWLDTELIVPPHAEVANAVGAVVGGVLLQRRVLLRPLAADDPAVRLYLPDGVRDFATLEEGVAHARQVIPAQLEEMARQAGAEQVEVRLARDDRHAPVAGGWGQKIYLETVLTFTAVGRPAMAVTPTAPAPDPGRR